MISTEQFINTLMLYSVSLFFISFISYRLKFPFEEGQVAMTIFVIFWEMLSWMSWFNETESRLSGFLGDLLRY